MARTDRVMEQEDVRRRPEALGRPRELRTDVGLGFGHIAASEIEAPNMLADMLSMRWVSGSDNATERALR